MGNKGPTIRNVMISQWIYHIPHCEQTHVNLYFAATPPFGAHRSGATSPVDSILIPMIFPWMWPSSGVVWLKIVRLQEKDAAHAEKMMCSSVVSYGSRMCSISSIHLQVWSTHFPMGANGLWPLGTLTLIISKFSWQLRWSSSPCSARRPATCLSASLSRATCSFGFLDSSPKTSEEIESSKGHPKATDRSTIYSNPKSIQIQTRPKNKKPPPKSHQNHPPQALCRLHPTHLHRWGGPLQERRTGTQRSRERPAGTHGWGVGDEHNVAGLSEFHPKLFQGEKKWKKLKMLKELLTGSMQLIEIIGSNKESSGSMCMCMCIFSPVGQCRLCEQA